MLATTHKKKRHFYKPLYKSLFLLKQISQNVLKKKQQKNFCEQKKIKNKKYFCQKKKITNFQNLSLWANVLFFENITREILTISESLFACHT